MCQSPLSRGKALKLEITLSWIGLNIGKWMGTELTEKKTQYVCIYMCIHLRVIACQYICISMQLSINEHSNTPGEYCTMTHIKYRET